MNSYRARLVSSICIIVVAIICHPLLSLASTFSQIDSSFISLSDSLIDYDSGYYNDSDNPTIVHTLDYDHLESGKTYTVKGQLFEVDLGKTDIISAKSTDIRMTKQFTVPSDKDEPTASGHLDIVYEINDYSDVAGKIFVPFEFIYDGNNKVASFADFVDSTRYICVPFFSNSVVDSISQSSIVSIVDGNTLTSSIKYRNVIIGKEYVAETTILSKNDLTNSWYVVRDNSGNPIKGSASFTPEKIIGKFDFSINIDVNNFVGKDLAYYTEIKTNIDGELRTIYSYESGDDIILTVPEYNIRITDNQTKKPVAQNSENANFTVSISCSTKLDSNYSAIVTLYDSETNEIVFDKNNLECSKETKLVFTKNKPSVQVSFNVNSKNYSGHKWYCKVDILDENIVVGTIGNASDDRYCMYFPSITALSVTNSENGSNTLNITSNSHSINTTLHYNYILPGISYRTITSLASDSTGSSRNSYNDTFTPTDYSGEHSSSISLTRRYVSNNYGKTVQVNEYIYIGNVIVAAYTNQSSSTTISIPSPTPTPIPSPTPSPTPRPTATTTPKPSSGPYDYAYQQFFAQNEWTSAYYNYYAFDIDNHTVLVMMNVHSGQSGYPIYGTYSGSFSPGNSIVLSLDAGNGDTWNEYVNVNSNSIEVDTGYGSYVTFTKTEVTNVTSHLP